MVDKSDLILQEIRMFRKESEKKHSELSSKLETQGQAINNLNVKLGRVEVCIENHAKVIEQNQEAITLLRSTTQLALNNSELANSKSDTAIKMGVGGAGTGFTGATLSILKILGII